MEIAEEDACSSQRVMDSVNGLSWSILLTTIIPAPGQYARRGLIFCRRWYSISSHTFMPSTLCSPGPSTIFLEHSSVLHRDPKHHNAARNLTYATDQSNTIHIHTQQSSLSCRFNGFLKKDSPIRIRLRLLGTLFVPSPSITSVSSSPFTITDLTSFLLLSRLGCIGFDHSPPLSLLSKSLLPPDL